MQTPTNIVVNIEVGNLEPLKDFLGAVGRLAFAADESLATGVLPDDEAALLRSALSEFHSTLNGLGGGDDRG